jgi:urease accessory protein
MTWHAHLSLHYAYERERSVARYQHEGPLRILQSLYPEGDAICHNVLVHPPGGFVGGDVMDIQVKVDRHAHGLVTTPGATRYYRTEQGAATNSVKAHLDEGARLEWLPLESLAYPGCDAINRIEFHLAPSAELMAWDITALGLDQANAPFTSGRYLQHLEIPGIWLERGLIDAQDHRLMNSPLALAGHRCMGTLLFAAGSPLSTSRAEAALEATRALIDSSPLKGQAGVTLAHPQVLVLRVLTSMVEPAMQLLRPAWAAWRHSLWQLPGLPPRLWNL